jgi:hypothetical protein
MPAPLDILDRISDAAAQDGARHGSATKYGAQYTSETARLRALRLAALATRVRRGRARLRGLLGIHAFEGLVRKKREQSHCGLGHAAAPGSRRLRLAARTVLHSIQNIEKSHTQLLSD